MKKIIQNSKYKLKNNSYNINNGKLKLNNCKMSKCHIYISQYNDLIYNKYLFKLSNNFILNQY